MKTCSVIVPIYNAAPYLAQCLSSIKMQTYPDLQVILIDDGSTDESAAIAQAFVDSDARFVLYRQTNQGQSAARNAGLAQATGEYLVFVDADDTLHPLFIEQHMAVIGDAHYVQSGYIRVLPDGAVLTHKTPRHRYQFTTPWARLYRTDYIREHHLTFPLGMIYEDVIFSLQLWSTRPHIVLLPMTLYHYTLNTQSTTVQADPGARHTLYRAVWHTQVSLWLRILTLGRLTFHFIKTQYDGSTT